jgi:hypothetical protein
MAEKFNMADFFCIKIHDFFLKIKMAEFIHKKDDGFSKKCQDFIIAQLLPS